MPHSHDNRHGIVSMVVSMAAFNVNDTFMKLATASLPATQILALRNLVAVIALLSVVIAWGEVRQLSHSLKPIVLVRGLLEAASSMLFVIALAQLPIATVTAIAISSPLFITALSPAFLGEKVGWRRWCVTVIGLLGVVLITRPGTEGFNGYALFAIGTAIVVAFRDLLTRKIAPTVPSHAVTATATASVMLVAMALGLVEMATGENPWQALDLYTGAFVVFAGIFVVIGNHLVIMAFRGGEVSVVSPFRYSVMVWAMLGGMFIFGDRPDAWSLAGIALIIGSGLFTLHRETAPTRDQPL